MPYKPPEAAGKFEHFARHGAVEPVHLRDAVSDLDDGAGFLDVDLLVEAFDLFLDDRADFFCLDLHGYSLLLATVTGVLTLGPERSSPESGWFPYLSRGLVSSFYSRVSSVCIAFRRPRTVLSTTVLPI